MNQPSPYIRIRLDAAYNPAKLAEKLAVELRGAMGNRLINHNIVLRMGSHSDDDSVDDYIASRQAAMQNGLKAAASISAAYVEGLRVLSSSADLVVSVSDLADSVADGSLGLQELMAAMPFIRAPGRTIRVQAGRGTVGAGARALGNPNGVPLSACNAWFTASRNLNTQGKKYLSQHIEEWKRLGATDETVHYLIDFGFTNGGANTRKTKITYDIVDVSILSTRREAPARYRDYAAATDGVDIIKADSHWHREIHHEYPWRYASTFARLGIDVNDPKYLKQVFRADPKSYPGARPPSHKNWSKKWDKAYADTIERIEFDLKEGRTTIAAAREQVEQIRRRLIEQYGPMGDFPSNLGSDGFPYNNTPE